MTYSVIRPLLSPARSCQSHNSTVAYFMLFISSHTGKTWPPHYLYYQRCLERNVGHARCSARKACRGACELRLLHVIKISFIPGTSRLLSAISTIFSFISVFVSMVTVVVVLPKLHKNVHAIVA